MGSKPTTTPVAGDAGSDNYQSHCGKEDCDNKQKDSASAAEAVYNTGIVDERKTPEQLLAELRILQEHIDRLEKSASEHSEAEAELREAVEMKSVFLSTVTHELRTPLTAMQEGIGIVLDGLAGQVNNEQADFLNIVKRNVDRLSRLIDEVLDFQKIDSGKMRFDVQANDINEVAENVYKAMAPAAQTVGVDFQLNLESNLPKVKFDSDRITQVLTNIVCNSMKFTEEGSIEISTSRGENHIRVSVSDTGCGIRKEDLPRVFREFEQIERLKHRKVGGTGLGLTISKKIIEQHRGRICVESEYGKGTIFYFILPIIEQRKKPRRNGANQYSRI